MRGWILALVLSAAPAAAQQAAEFPRNASFIIQLTSSQASSGFGAYLVPPLDRAFRKTGLRYEGGPAADYAATIETGSDVGKWHGSGDDRVWLYERFVTVGLSPAEMDVEPEGKLSPAFSITVNLVTPNEDRVDELNCLVALATRELAARYQPTGNVRVNGQGCARKK
jgi:hypothetical protein